MLSRLCVVIAVIVVTIGGARFLTGCADCTETGCGISEQCIEGVCRDVPPATLRFVSPFDGRVTGDSFEAILEVSFRGNAAVVDITRAGGESGGDPCTPFVPRTITLDGVPGASVTQRVVVLRNMPTLGPSFSLLAQMTAGTQSVITRGSFTTTNAAPINNDIRIVSPRSADVDVRDVPLTTVRVQAPALGNGIVFAEAANVLGGGSATPRVPLVSSGGEQSATVPTLRGPHIVWVEGEVNGSPRRCGVARVGGPPTLRDNVIDLVVLSSSDGDFDHWLDLEARITGASPSGETFCNGRAVSEVPCDASDSQNAPDQSGRDRLLVEVESGIVEVAVIPRITSGPVTVQVIVSKNARHIALLGPLTLRPADGETWLAAQVLVDDGDVTGVINGDAPTIGRPW